MTPCIQVENLTVNYQSTPVLWDISFSLPKGCLAAILGPNGAGKTTLLKSLLGLIRPLSGSIEYLGKSLKDLKGQVAYVPQRESVDWSFPMTVKELVLMGCYGKLGLFNFPRLHHHQQAMKWLKAVKMEGFANRQIRHLSGGQQQRVFFARAMMQEAQLYFLDEPFSGVDKSSEAILFECLHLLKESGKSIFVVHHDLNTVRDYFDWVVMLNMSLITCGRVEEAFVDKNLKKTFGKSFGILEEVAKLSHDKQQGMLS